MISKSAHRQTHDFMRQKNIVSFRREIPQESVGVKTGIFRQKPKHVSSTFFTSLTKVMKKTSLVQSKQPWTWSRDFRCASFLLFFTSLFYRRSTADSWKNLRFVGFLTPLISSVWGAVARHWKSSAGRSVAARLARNAPLRKSKNYRGLRGE